MADESRRLLRKEIDTCGVLLRSAQSQRNRRTAVALDLARRAHQHASELLETLADGERAEYLPDLASLDAALKRAECAVPDFREAGAGHNLTGVDK